MKATALRRQQLRSLRQEMMKAGTLEEGQLIPKELIKIKNIK